MTRIAFGPRTTAPSWEWVGVETARELSRYFDVSLFEDFERVPAADLVIVVKVHPSASFVADVRATGACLAYIPIDAYFSQQQIEDDAEFLRACDLVLLHCETLLPHMAPFCQRVGIVEHHTRFALDKPADFKLSGFVLWVGGCQHIPHVVKWLEENRLPADVRFLTNFNHKTARMGAHFKAHEIGVRLRFGDDTINGHRTYLWSGSMQQMLMRECKAAVDIKGVDFNQSTKPPTKAQQFIASGIPFGCNLDSSVAHYFRSRGFGLSDAADTDLLLSQEYWEETQSFATRLRTWTSLDAVGRSYRQEFEALLDGGPGLDG